MCLNLCSNVLADGCVYIQRLTCRLLHDIYIVACLGYSLDGLANLIEDRTKFLLLHLVERLLVVLGCLWLYGFVGVKAGWIGPTEVPGLNAISHSGAEAAGGVAAAAKSKIGL